MGNNNTSTIKEEGYTSEAEKKNRQDDIHKDSLKEENQIYPTDKSEYAADTGELGNEISQEETHEDGLKGDDHNIPVTSEANAVLENAAKASHDTTLKHGKDKPPEDVHTDDLKGRIQTDPIDEGKDVEEKATWPTSDLKRSVLENDSFKGDTCAGDAHVENQMHPIDEDEDVLDKSTDNTRSKHERNSCEEYTCKEDVNVDENLTAEGTDVQQIAARLALDEASDPVRDITQENAQANDKDESTSILFGGGTDVPEQEILEVGKPETTPNAEPVEDGGENCEILSSFTSLEVAEDYGKQTESCLSKNMLVTYHHHIDSEPTTEEEEDTKVLILDAMDMSNEAELQESPVVDTNHKELAKVLSESSLSESWPEGDFLDTNPLYSQDDNDVIEREAQTQENNASSDEPEGTNADSPSGKKTDGNLLTKVNHISDDSLNSPSESVNAANPLTYYLEETYKVLHEERKMSRSGSTIENSHDHNPNECLQEPQIEFKACMANTKDMTTVSNGERNEVFTSCKSTDEVEMPKATENGHHFHQNDDNPNKASDEVVKKIEEIYKEPEVSHATEKSLEGREMLEQCNSHLVTVESFTLQSSDSLLHIYRYQEDNEDQTKNLTATSMEKASDWKQANDDKAFEKEKEDYSSQHVEATSTSVFSEQCPNNSTYESGVYYETRESATRLSTESNPEQPTIFFQIQKSPSFNLNLQNGESSDESDQSPLLFQDKCATGSLSHQNSLHIMNSSWPHSENDHCSLDHEEMPVEEKTVTMEISYTEKSKAPLLCYSKEDDEASLLVSSQEHAITYKAVKDVTPTSPKPKEKRRSMSSFFINCMCCATVAN